MGKLGFASHHPLLKCGSGHEADSGTAAEIYVMRLPKPFSEFRVQLA
jgi:hypothetical protein